MIVLHAIRAQHGRVCLWGEIPWAGAPARAPDGPRGRPGRPAWHPFAASREHLREALGRSGGTVVAGALVDEELVLLLPSSARRPLASPALPVTAGARSDDEADRLSPWRIPVCALEAAAGLDLLLSLPAGSPPGVVLGDDLRWLGEVAKLALELCAGGRLVPALELHDGRHFARWRPALADDKDAERLRLLERIVPPAARSEVVAGAGAGAAGRPPRLVVEEALDGFVDACAREALVRRRLLLASRRDPPRSPAIGGWLVALAEQDPEVAGDPVELATLKAQLDDWVRPARSTPGGARTCFRLSPPGPAPDGQPTGPWRLDFLLQSLHDRSLLVPADDVWSARVPVEALGVERPQEQLLADLGRAVRLFPGLERALRAARPSGMELDAAEAHGFLREATALLAQGGFGVLVPPWWGRPTARLGARLRAAPRAADGDGQGHLGLAGLCAYEWQLALGEESITLEELRRLAALKVPLVQVRDRWVELRPDEIDAALAVLDRQGAHGEMTVAQVLRVGLGLDRSPLGVPVVAVEAEGWLRQFLASTDDARLEPAATPEGFAGTLRPYQERGLAWLLFLDRMGLGACLADDMGLGKTVQLLALLCAERAGASTEPGPLRTAQGGLRRPRPTLLVCPMSVVGNWQRETARFAPGLAVYVHHGGGRASRHALARAIRQRDLVITTYALAARDAEALAGLELGRVVLDEAQNIKNSAARQTQAVRALRAPRRVALTGTPVENRLAELWSISEFLNPGLLGTASDFRTRFATPIERYRDEEQAALLRRITGPFFLRRLKTDRRVIQDLPEKLEIKVLCNLTREQGSLYQAILDDMMERIAASQGIERKGLVLATMMKLKQVCNHPAQLLGDRSSLHGRSGKLALLEEALDEILAVGDRALLFTQFAEMGRLLVGHLQERLGLEVPFLHGGASRKARDEMVARFQGERGPPLFVLSLRAGGTGLNLTAANHVIHFDRWWNPAVEDQATDRAFRIGQRRNVQVRKLVCVGTLEERIDQMIEDKQALARRIVGSGEAWLTALSTAELREVLALSPAAVAE